jgi:hypothetical protein
MQKRWLVTLWIRMLTPWGREHATRTLLFVAEPAFCRRSRYWRQKSQVASLLELVSDSTGDKISDRKNERSIQARVDDSRQSVASAALAGKTTTNHRFLSPSLSFVAKRVFGDINPKLVPPLGLRLTSATTICRLGVLSR